MIATPTVPVKTPLRSAGMRVAAVTAGVLVALTVTASAADAPNTHPRTLTAPSSPLSREIPSLSPYAYWPLNDGASTQSDASGNDRPALTTTGTGRVALG